MKLDFCEYSNCGERPVNEDSTGVYENNGLYVFTVCDGLGGHGSGDIASKTAVEAIINTAKSAKFDGLLDACLKQANAAVVDEQNRRGLQNQMKTTATLLAISDGKAKWAHIGDSRINYFKRNKFIRRTADHSVPQMLVNAGKIKEKDIRHHEDRNRLLRCIPWEENKEYSIDEEGIQLSSGDSFILMSDGFWDWIDEKCMEKALKKTKTAAQTVEKLTELAFKYGKGNNMDNLSIIVVRMN